ncbi:MAG TPA: alpha/beta fold hydrolase [Aromatoleum sp.]|uniref:alpha/beta fold hydrolase n=1 Tax=Aromatoleum sp. TaxID=2307007 RepID=UPI002B4A77D7|nr:alpha/beta fold hydrolase [Aromatoleum sp.]HJV26928.1 alpha/beta fold hydrolase [Aromatoleum sp.]
MSEPMAQARSLGWLESLDKARRYAGQMLDRLELGRQESVFEVVLTGACARLRAYSPPEHGAPVLLLVPAPIKRPYIWDLSPERSVVRRAMQCGFEVYLIDWSEAHGDENRLGLAAYALATLDDCVEAIRARSQADRICLAGHSLGGTFAALYAAYRPMTPAGLVLVEAPVHFGEATGAFRRMLDSGVPARTLFPSSPRIPGSLINLLSVCASPVTFEFERYADFVASLASRAAFETHCRVERWALDELALPRRLFEEVVELLYREDRFMRGELVLGDRLLLPGDVRAPLLAVYDPASRIVPPASVLDFCALAGSAEKEAILYHGDTGVALKHVGALVGEDAHRRVWPAALDWLLRESETRARP